MCKVTTTIALILLIVGGLNWGLVGAADIDLVAMLFGTGILAKIVYVLVGLSALYCLAMFKKLNSCSCEIDIKPDQAEKKEEKK